MGSATSDHGEDWISGNCSSNGRRFVRCSADDLVDAAPADAPDLGDAARKKAAPSSQTQEAVAEFKPLQIVTLPPLLNLSPETVVSSSSPVSNDKSASPRVSPRLFPARASGSSSKIDDSSNDSESSSSSSDKSEAESIARKGNGAEKAATEEAKQDSDDSLKPSSSAAQTESSAQSQEEQESSLGKQPQQRNGSRNLHVDLSDEEAALEIAIGGSEIAEGAGNSNGQADTDDEETENDESDLQPAFAAAAAPVGPSASFSPLSFSSPVIAESRRQRSSPPSLAASSSSLAVSSAFDSIDDSAPASAAAVGNGDGESKKQRRRRRPREVQAEDENEAAKSESAAASSSSSSSSSAPVDASRRYPLRSAAARGVQELDISSIVERFAADLAFLAQGLLSLLSLILSLLQLARQRFERRVVQARAQPQDRRTDAVWTRF